MLMQTLNQILEEKLTTKTNPHHLPINIEENEKGYLIKAKCHGFTKHDITIEYNKPYITIKGKKEKKGNNECTIWQEFEEIDEDLPENDNELDLGLNPGDNIAETHGITVS